MHWAAGTPRCKSDDPQSFFKFPWPSVSSFSVVRSWASSDEATALALATAFLLELRHFVSHLIGGGWRYSTVETKNLSICAQHNLLKSCQQNTRRGLLAGTVLLKCRNTAPTPHGRGWQSTSSTHSPAPPQRIQSQLKPLLKLRTPSTATGASFQLPVAAANFK